MRRRRILPLRLTQQDPSIRRGILARSENAPAPQPRKTGLRLDHGFLLVVHIQNVNLARPPGECARHCPQKPPHHHRAKWIEEKQHRGPRRPLELKYVSMDNAHWARRPSMPPPQGQVALRNPHQRRVQLHPQNTLKTKLRPQQHRASHPRAHIDERRVRQRRWPRPPPSPHHFPKHRRRHSVARRCMPRVRMFCLQMPPRHQSAGAHAMCHIERMHNIPGGFGQSRKRSAAGFAWHRSD